MALHGLCDQCGEELDLDAGEVSCVDIMVSTRIERGSPEMNMPAFFMGVTMRRMGGELPPDPRKHEHYDLCPACAMALMIALKQAKARVLKAKGRVGHASHS